MTVWQIVLRLMKLSFPAVFTDELIKKGEYSLSQRGSWYNSPFIVPILGPIP